MKYAPETRIKDLSWQKETLKIKTYRVASGNKKFMEMIGTYRGGENSRLLVNKNPVKLAKDGRFLWRWPLDPETASIEFLAIDSNGTVLSEALTIVYLPAKTPSSALTKSADAKKNARGVCYSVGFGVASLQYLQTGLDSFSQISMTGKLSASYGPPSSKWDYGMNAFLTGVNVKSSAAEGAPKVSFVGMNGRVGYQLYARSPWTTTLYGGIYYASASGSVLIDDSAVLLGYQVFGPQLVLATSRALAKNDRIGGYLKFASVTEKIKFQLASHELAGGLNYQFKPDVLGRTIGMGVDLSKITLTLGSDTVDVSSASLSGSYSF